MIKNPSNWAGNYTFRAAQFHQPETIEQIQELILHSHKLKAQGTRHSFNDIADSPGELVSLQHFNKILGLDRDYHTVTVEAGNTHHTVHASDATAPELLRPLLEKLSSLAKESNSNAGDE